MVQCFSVHPLCSLCLCGELSFQFWLTAETQRTQRMHRETPTESLPSIARVKWYLRATNMGGFGNTLFTVTLHALSKEDDLPGHTRVGCSAVVTGGDD
jgi:hypothetical protein